MINRSIAIDGPAGSGKSTIAKIIAKENNLMYINTGAMYRAVTYYAIKAGISYDEVSKLIDLIDNLEMHFEGDRLIVNGTDITDELTYPEISNNVSNYAAVKEVREKLVSFQQKMSQKYEVIMDGRDIGTVVLKDAKYKFFLTAKAEERAKRRCKELIEKGIEVDFNNILEEIEKRDYIDTHREINPLTKADDAMEIDTSSMTIDEVVKKISGLLN
ncbi:(d)CMP kinase [Clostridium cellulovorans]|uniref:Cytidylate kinase n=1 Tax=Clostridium cellulovorans (strain ATCC 35296 / DSM 3052 / OCM 3 / 743B) TaxID=573061 RepID=D9SN16_CLOC7|nr:(d)CMP kinase [Clostridium cellulovorans]ADL51882.1 cytidylate kinase [Clostridium cellulovorans 743B]